MATEQVPEKKLPVSQTEMSTRVGAAHYHNMSRDELLSLITEKDTLINSLSGKGDILESFIRGNADSDYFKQSFLKAGVAATITSLDGKLTPNPAFCNLLGYDAAEMGAMNWQQISFPADVQKSQRAVEILLSGEKETTVFEKRYYHRSGAVIWVEINITLICDAQHRPQMFLGIVHDITERVHAHDQLLIHRERLNQAVEIAKLGIWEWVIEADKLIFSAEMFRQLELDVDVFSGRGKDYPHILGSFTAFADIYSGTVRPDSAYRTTDILMREKEREFELITSRGNKKILQISSSLIYDSNGKPEKVLGVCSDITEKIQREKERIDREKLLLKTENAGKVGSMEMNLRTTSWRCSPNLEVLLGLTGNEIKDSQLWVQLLGEEQVTKFTEYFINISLHKAPDFTVELKVRRLNDKKEILLNASGEITYDENGIPLSFFSLLRDETEQRTNVNRMLAMREKFSAAFYTSPDAIAISRVRDGQFIEINPMFTAITGYTAEDIRESSNNKTGIWVDTVQRDELVALLKKDGMFAGQEVLFRRKDGTIFTALGSASLLHIEGEPCIISVVRDITSRKQMENELRAAKDKAEESNKLKSSFLTNMSHELRTPMIGILGYSELLADSSENEDVKKAAAVIQRSGKRLLNTLNLLFDISRLEAGTVPKYETETNALELLEEIAEEHQVRADEKGIKLTYVTPLNELLLVTDKSILRSIMDNLLDNAVKYTNTGEVRVFINRKFIENEVNAVIRISDTGIGIREEDMEKVWMEFRQASEGIGRRYEGVGLGLSITKRMVSLLNGTIELESEFGKGTTVTISIPGVIL